MPSFADSPVSWKSTSRRLAAWLTIWNRKLHYYVGLYLLLFLWLFAFSGLLLNHSSWAFAQFFQDRRISKYERSIQSATSTGDFEQARSVTRQLGIEGEIGFAAPRSNPAHLDFTVSRPGQNYHFSRSEPRPSQRHTERLQRLGHHPDFHTFVGVTLDDPRNEHDWILTTIWAFSMDAVAAGVIFVVLSTLYMWWRLKDKRKAGTVALALGITVCGLFVSGLRWLYT